MAALIGALCGPATASRGDCQSSEPGVIEIEDGAQQLDALREAILKVLSSDDRKLVQDVRLCSPSLIGIQNVGALKRVDSGRPLVIFGFDAQLALHELGRATAVGRVKGVASDYLDGFARYRATPMRFAELPMSADDFAIRFGGPGLAERIASMPEGEFNRGQNASAALVLFVLAHELAHHVYGDVLAPMESAGVSRAAELRADRWAAGVMHRLGVEPGIAAMGMLLLNELERKSQFERTNADHPPPLARGIALLVESERLARESPEWLGAYYAPFTPPTAIPAAVQRHGERIGQLKVLLEKQLADEDRLRNDNRFLMQQAIDGSTKARMLLSDAFASGKRSGVPQNWDAARQWMQRALDDATPYEIDYKAEATSGLAHLHLGPGGDRAYACRMARAAVDMRHLWSMSLLERLQRDKICEP